MTEDDYRTALNIIEKTLSAYQKETGEICRGFLYGQFIHTSRGIKLVEYNFRPGDPEWLNTLAVMEEPLHEVILKLMEEEDFSITFQSKTTVCKYIVPPEYPEELYQTLDVSFDESKIQQMGVDLYYSCGKDKDQELNVGSERGIALIGKGTTIEEANRRVEKAISQIKGDFHYRNDIGTESLIQETINVSQRGG